MQIHSGNSQSVNGSINGRGIKHRDLTHRQLVELAADAVSGVHPVVPSLSQASKIFEGQEPRHIAGEDEAGTAIVFAGSIFGDWKFYGPFTDLEAARKWTWADGTDCVIELRPAKELFEFVIA
jgi:hypothetical protein